jgi:hypothetical protein
VDTILLTIGSATADPVIDIQTNTGSVKNGDTLNIPAGVDASTAVGLKAVYDGGWVKGDEYKVSVTQITPSLGEVWTDSIVTGLPSAIYTSNIHYTFTKGNTYIIKAEGTKTGLITEVYVRVTTAPVITPELPTSALMSVGLIGLVSVARFRRKN